MINCVFAKGTSDGTIKCRNSAKSHLQIAAQAFCFRCKARVPVDRDMAAIVETLPRARQMRIEEWLEGV